MINPPKSANDALPLFQDEPARLGEPGVRDLYGVYVFNWDALLEGRAERLLNAAPAPEGLTDAQLEMAASAFYRQIGSPRANRRAWRLYFNRVRAEQAARAALREAV